MQVEHTVPLSKRTFWGIGGVADTLITVEHIAELPPLWAQLHASKTPCRILGKGSNTAWADAGFRGTVVHLSAAERYWQPQPEGKMLLIADAGVIMSQLVEDTARAGYADLERMAGIPGQLGGFVRGNAEAFGSGTWESLQWVDMCDGAGQLWRIVVTQRPENGVHSRNRAKTSQTPYGAGERYQITSLEDPTAIPHTREILPQLYSYRMSIFKAHDDWGVLRAGFLLSVRDDPEATLQRVQSLSAHRWQTYPPGRTGGSTFINPPGAYAGRLLEEAGAKGQHCGGIEITQQHANFFRNTGHGTQEELLTLMRQYRERVERSTGICLTPEVVLLDEWGRERRDY
ncbi:FAD-binding protein [Candidatus Peribacteria bacterium]|nr:FAD-binding protein [Candidatus Peribacteria bacterium]